MREVGVVSINWVVPVESPDKVFFDGAHDAFGIGVAFWIAPSCEDLFKAQDRA